MIAEMGLLALVLALLFALLLGIIPTIGLYKENRHLINTVNWYVAAQFGFMALAYCCLTWCFASDDFSLRYVVNNSSNSLPLFYKLCAVWGGHEGSMLLWIMILNLWMLAVMLCSQHLPIAFRTRILIILGWISAGLLLFLITTSNPFLRQFQLVLTQGRDLNPLLQDPGFLFHPPMLYMGYVGFSVAFAFAVAALWIGEVESSWAKWTRPWTLSAWCCLTLGITLGSWWAYRELGWGGWWFWDPVENASFMPWLAGTALLHSLAVSEKRQQFIAWTLLLAIITFSLSLLGTFLVRSGVLTSVHAFAVDPQRGLFILIFLIVVIGGAFFLFAVRAQKLQSQQSIHWFSKESGMLLNNVFLVVSMLTVLLGTTYPLLIDGLGLGKLSVGAPYFNFLFPLLMLPLCLLLGLGIHVHWQSDRMSRVFYKLKTTMVLSILLPCFILWAWGPVYHFLVLLPLIFAFWIILSTLKLAIERIKKQGLFSINQGFYGMVCAHLGVAGVVIGIAVSSGYGQQADLKFSPRESAIFAGYTLKFLQESPLNEVNYSGTKAHFQISNQQYSRTIYPEKRIYNVGKMVMTDAAIDVNPFRDLYIALGEPLPGEAWAVRVYFKPFIRWIWGGGFVIFLGGVLALTDRRYYSLGKKS